MASKLIFAAAVVIMAAFLPAFVSATDYVVGDDQGWNLNVNYTAWAEGKMFMVGDTLVFNYPPGKHNVVKVAGPAFKACNASAQLGDPLTTGKDPVTLAAPGAKWYICGFPGHCDKGMKLVINVMDMNAPAPAPPTSDAVEKPSARVKLFLLLAIVVAAMFVMV